VSAGADGGRRPAGALESEVLTALWAAGRPLTPAEVRDELAGDLAYTTVMTALARLHDKGVVERARSGRAYAYRPAVDQAAAVAERMAAALAETQDREGVLASFVGSLSERDERLLAELLRETDDERGQ
jgi:predicted transcriptional regulator